MFDKEETNQYIGVFACALARLRTRSDYGSLELFASFSFQEKKKKENASDQYHFANIQ